MGIRRRLRSVLWRVPVEQEVREELSHHVELRARELIDRGWTPGAARTEAERRARGTEGALVRLATERNRAFAMRDWLDALRQDLGFALRQCRIRPGFTAAAALTLALGIGATTAIFSVVYAIVLRPFPFPEPDRVLYVFTTWQEGRSSTSAGNYDYIRQRASSLEHLAAASHATFTLADEDGPERVLGMRVTWDYFSVFGIPPLHGRTFAADEDRPGHEQVVILSHRLWVRHFGGDPSVLGRQLHLSGQPYDVIGVMPSTFDEVAGNEQLWVPAAFTPDRLAMYDEHFLELYGLRRADTTLAQVNDELGRVAEGLRRDHPDFNHDRGAEAQAYGDFHTAPFRMRLVVLLAAVFLVLLIACGNVANLLLASLVARARELAVRAAIGAGRGRIVRQVITESLVLAGLGGTAGVLVAYWLLPVLVAGAPGGDRVEAASLSTPLLAVSLLLVLGSALVVGILPAWQVTRRHGLRDELGDGKGGSGSVRPWVRQTLIATQAALALTVLAGAALLVRSAINLEQVPLGFDHSGTLVARVSLVGPHYREPARVKAVFRQLHEHLQEAPGVAMAAFDTQPPLLAWGTSNGLIPEGAPLSMESIIPSQTHFITPDYFRALGIPLRAGRPFTREDVRSASLVMIVNETLARRAFGAESPIGRRMTCCEGDADTPAWKTIVGVAADVRSRGPAHEPQPEFYLPVEQVPDAAWSWIQNTLWVLVRPEIGEPEAMSPIVRAALGRIDPTLPVYGDGTFEEGFRLMMHQTRANTLLMSLLGLTGLALAALGIYSVVAWLASLRTREIGLRIALGATSGRLVRHMTWHGMRPVAIGLTLGLLGAVATTRLLEAQLFQVSARDPFTLAVVALLLLACAGVAALVPAWRASRIDPAEALRDG